MRLLLACVIKQEAPDNRLLINDDNEDNADNADNAETTSQDSNPDNIQNLLMRTYWILKPQME